MHYSNYNDKGDDYFLTIGLSFITQEIMTNANCPSMSLKLKQNPNGQILFCLIELKSKIMKRQTRRMRF